MGWVGYVSGVVILIVSYMLWPRSDRDMASVLITALVISAITVIINAIALSYLPIERTEIVHRRILVTRVHPPKEIYKVTEKVVYKTPGTEMQPVDAKSVCKGGMPVQIMRISYASKDNVTWEAVKPVGREMTLVCGSDGDFTGYHKVGDIVQLTNGKPA